MPVRLLIAALLLLGPLPLRSCACAAEHATTDLSNDNDSSDRSEPVHHDPDCPLAKPPHPKPAITAPVVAIDVDSDVSIFEPLANLDLSWSRTESVEPLKRDRSIPFWLVHLAIQI